MSFKGERFPSWIYISHLYFDVIIGARCKYENYKKETQLPSKESTPFLCVTIKSSINSKSFTADLLLLHVFLFCDTCHVYLP